LKHPLGTDQKKVTVHDMIYHFSAESVRRSA
jgi:hypothetical protein